MSEELGEAFARAVAAKDWARLGDLLQPDVDFRGMTPGRTWENPGADGVVDALGRWFDDDDEITDLLALEVDSFADRERVGYRLHVRNPDGEHVVEQQAYLSGRGGRIGWLRIMCSGFRPVPGVPGVPGVSGGQGRGG